jgi:SAM-dependent methyltransferase
MEDRVLSFYEALARSYHLLFEDWNRSIERQAKAHSAILTAEMPGRPLKILDCACGIGTQALGLAALGHRVVGSDLSPAAVARARREAADRGLEISFHVSDMTSLAEIEDGDFDVAAAFDNAIPHLSAERVRLAVAAMGSKLRPGGLFLASIRDYDRIAKEKPKVDGPAFFGGRGKRRIVHQVWDWIDDERHTVHLYITVESESGWTAHHFVSEYRCLPRDELSRALQASGFKDVRWMMPSETGLYIPLVLARRQ